jgi:hypothetical protein
MKFKWETEEIPREGEGAFTGVREGVEGVDGCF